MHTLCQIDAPIFHSLGRMYHLGVLVRPKQREQCELTQHWNESMTTPGARVVRLIRGMHARLLSYAACSDDAMRRRSWKCARDQPHGVIHPAMYALSKNLIAPRGCGADQTRAPAPSRLRNDRNRMSRLCTRAVSRKVDRREGLWVLANCGELLNCS